MDLRAEIDRGEVVPKRPAPRQGRTRRSGSPRSATARPSRCTRAWARARWPCAAGQPPSAAGRRFERSDGSMALKYKASVTGDALWPEILATPTWHPSPGMPTRRLLIKRGDTWVPKSGGHRPGLPRGLRAGGDHASTRSRLAQRRRTTARGPPYPDPRHSGLPIGQARREQRLPPAAQPPGPAPGGLRRAPPRATCATASCPRITCGTSNTRVRKLIPRERQQGLPFPS